MSEAGYTILGTSADVDSCQCCGKQGLKKTVILRDSEGDVTYFGTDCAAKVVGRPSKFITRAAKDADTARRQAARAEQRARLDAEIARWEAWLIERTGQSDTLTAIRALGGLAAADAEYRAAM